jgi:hypothetical protein
MKHELKLYHQKAKRRNGNPYRANNINLNSNKSRHQYGVRNVEIEREWSLQNGMGI